MTPAEIIARAREFGATLKADGDDLVVDYACERPPAAFYETLRERKIELLEHLRSTAAAIERIEVQRPSDVSDDHWKAAIAGLEAFLVDGWGDEAKAHGWSHDELYAVPPRWAAINRCGAALLIGGDRVVEVSAEAIVIETATGARQRVTRKRPEELARITAWINAKLITWPQTHCLHCRKPINVGEKFVDVAANDERARFHVSCEPVWRAAQIVAARVALGLP
jgi:hypothetical protein